MATERVVADRVLIVPNYTPAETELLRDEKTADSVKPPISYYFQCAEVSYTPGIPQYEEFESAQGLIMIEKACNSSSELELSIYVHQMMYAQTDKLQLGTDKTSDVRSTLSLDRWDTTTREYVNPMELSGTGNNEDAWATTPDFIELRRGFFDYLYGRPLTIVSALFPPMPVAYLQDIEYQIDEGEEFAVYEVTFKETLSI